MKMTKKKLLDALRDDWEKSREYVKDAKTADDISAESTLVLIGLSGNMVNTVTRYVVNGLPIVEWNRAHIVAGVKRAAKLLEDTLDEDEKGALGELEQMMDDWFEIVVTVRGEARK